MKEIKISPLHRSFIDHMPNIADNITLFDKFHGINFVNQTIISKFFNTASIAFNMNDNPEIFKLTK